MQVELIGSGAGVLWNILHTQGEKMDISQLKKASKLSDANFWASAGWLAKEGKIVYSSEKKGRRTLEFYALAD